MRSLAKVVPLISVILLCGCDPRPIASHPYARTPCVYEIPEGFTGWVLIEFENSNCPPVEVIDGKRVFRFGSDGRLCSSSKEQYGVALDEYYYVGKTRKKLEETGWGAGGMIWGEFTGGTKNPGKKETTYTGFFVGTEAQFDKAGAAPDI